MKTVKLLAFALFISTASFAQTQQDAKQPWLLRKFHLN